MKKIPIKNRHGLNILVHYEQAPDPAGKLSIIQHGYSGSMDEDHIRGFADIFLKNGYDVLLMDCTNSFNDADGPLENVTIKTHYEDLEDVIEWASRQEWYREPFALTGHSLGGMSVLHYAQNHPEKISLLFPAAPVISGMLNFEQFKKNQPDDYKTLQETGNFAITESYRGTADGYRPQAYYDELFKWTMLEHADKLTMPVLIIVGSEDTSCPPEHQKLLYDALPGEKEMHIIDGADHGYRPKLEEVLGHLNSWLQSR